jgi:hypothetical protein
MPPKLAAETPYLYPQMWADLPQSAVLALELTKLLLTKLPFLH